jgi:acetylornithine/N-succinyldiaminopimelate aminotransferase
MTRVGGEKNGELAARWSAVMMGNYRTPPIALARGAGATVWDVDGREYTDLLGGIATTILGHAHPKVVEAITRQAKTLGHVSNLAMHEPGVRLAERLLELAGPRWSPRSVPSTAGPWARWH